MTIFDARGVPLGHDCAQDSAALDAAFYKLVACRRDPVAMTGELLARRPDFCLATIFRAYLNMFSMDRTRVLKAREDLARARTTAAQAGPRERGHLHALTAWLDGDWETAADAWGDLLVTWPRDVYALKAGYLAAYYLGRPRLLRDRVAACLPSFDPDDPLYGYLLGMLAFGLEECGDYTRAERLGRRAVALNADDVWAVHAVAHVYEMRGRFVRGIRWLNTHRAGWTAEGNFFAVHTWWHLALFYLELEHHDHVLAIYDGPVRGDASSFVMDLEDAASVLWRLHLSDVPLGDRFQELAGFWREKAEDGLYSFNDVHAMMAFLGAGAHDDAARLLAAMARAARRGGTHGRVVAEVGLPLARGLQAFAVGDYGRAVELLRPLRYAHHRMGGSHAQRDVLVLTLMEAAMRDGQWAYARSLVSGRTVLQPHAPGNWRLLARVLRALGDEDGAAQAEARVRQAVARAARVPQLDVGVTDAP